MSKFNLWVGSWGLALVVEAGSYLFPPDGADEFIGIRTFLRAMACLLVLAGGLIPMMMYLTPDAEPTIYDRLGK